jgi:hypothetical protein
MTDFWKTWLTLWCLCVIIFGLILAGAAFTATDGIAAALFNLIGPEPFVPTQGLRFSVGLMGAVTIGWGGTFYAAFKAAHLVDPAKASEIWRIIVTVALVWFAIDSAISIATGFWMNAVSNTVFMTFLLIPILKTGVLRR